MASQVPQDIGKLLTEGGWSFDQLPVVRDDSTSWADVKAECNLSSPQLSSLKNIRCPLLRKYFLRLTLLFQRIVMEIVLCIESC